MTLPGDLSPSHGRPCFFSSPPRGGQDDPCEGTVARDVCAPRRFSCGGKEGSFLAGARGHVRSGSARRLLAVCVGVSRGGRGEGTGKEPEPQPGAGDALQRAGP